MPAIYGCAGLSASPAEVDRFAHRMQAQLGVERDSRKFLEAQWHDPPFLLGVHSINQLPAHKGIAHCGAQTLVMDGVLFDAAHTPALAKLLTAYAASELKAVHALRGYFRLAICDREKDALYLFTDHAATRPLYYAVYEAMLYFSGDCASLAQSLPQSAMRDPNAVLDMLTFGYMTGDKTPVQSIRRLAAGSCLHWNLDQASLKITPYFVPDNAPNESESYHKQRENLQRLFVNAVGRTLEGTKSLFTLSGGLDSRAVLTAAHQLGVRQPPCLIFGEESSLDVELAQRVGKQMDARTTLVPLDNGNYLVDTFAKTSRYNSGLVYFSGSAHMLHALQQLDMADFDLVQTGMSGDMLMGSFLRSRDIGTQAQGPDHIAHQIIAQLGLPDWITHWVEDQDDVQQRMSHSIEESVGQLNLSATTTLAQALELWNLNNRQQRAMFNGFRMIENFAEYTSPFFDPDLYQYTLKIPHKYRLEEGIYVDMLAHLIPSNVWRIPWQKTGRPPSRYKWINKMNKLSSLWGGRTLEVLAPSRARRRSMNPTRAWLRTNQRLRTFATEQLHSWESVPEPLSATHLRDFASDIEAERFGIRERLPLTLIRLLTVRAWDTLYSNPPNKK